MSAFLRQIDIESLIEQLAKDSLFVRMQTLTDLSGYQTGSWKPKPASEQVVDGKFKRVDEPMALVPNLE